MGRVRVLTRAQAREVSEAHNVARTGLTVDSEQLTDTSGRQKTQKDDLDREVFETNARLCRGREPFSTLWLVLQRCQSHNSRRTKAACGGGTHLNSCVKRGDDLNSVRLS